jgi:type VI secretion system protein ImpF
MLANRDETDRTLRFRIDAMLYAEPAPEPVIFDSELEPLTNSFSVASEAR